MANNYLQFSEAISDLTDDECDWLHRQLETVYVFGDREYTDAGVPGDLSPSDATWSGCRALRDYPDADGDVGFQCEFLDNEELGPNLWLYAEEGGDPLRVAHLVQKFLRKFRTDQCWSLTYATTCSKLRLGEFSGGAVFVTAEAVESFDAYDFVTARQTAFADRPHPARGVNMPCDCQMPGPFQSGVSGILAQMEHSRLAPGAKVERCDQCRRYPSDEAARQKLADMGLL